MRIGEQVPGVAMAEEMAIAQHHAARERRNMEGYSRESFMYVESLKALRFYEGMIHAIGQMQIRMGWNIDSDLLEQRRRELEEKHTCV